MYMILSIWSSLFFLGQTWWAVIIEYFEHHIQSQVIDVYISNSDENHKEKENKLKKKGKKDNFNSDKRLDANSLQNRKQSF